MFLGHEQPQPVRHIISLDAVLRFACRKNCRWSLTSAQDSTSLHDLTIGRNLRHSRIHGGYEYGWRLVQSGSQSEGLGLNRPAQNHNQFLKL